jgi:hypothetical protein
MHAMSEYGFRPRDEVSADLNNKYNEFAGRKTAAEADYRAAEQRLLETKPPREIFDAVIDLVTAAQESAKYRTDLHWLRGMNQLNRSAGILSDGAMVEAWDARDDAERDDPQAPDRTPPVVDTPDALDALLETGKPEGEIVARFEEAIGVARTSGILLEDADRDFRMTFPPEEVAEAAQTLVRRAQDHTQHEGDKTWVRALYEHPHVGPAPIIEVWDAIEAKRADARDPREE